jgi:hypothetical protein
MSLAPESAMSPMVDAPPDRPTADLEGLLRQVIAVIFGDRILDPNEQRVLRGFMEEIALRAQQGGIGMGGTPPAEAPPMSPMEMNANGAEDYGDGAGEPTGETY